MLLRIDTAAKEDSLTTTAWNPTHGKISIETLSLDQFISNINLTPPINRLDFVPNITSFIQTNNKQKNQIQIY